jgi:hypothetical protein
MAAQKEEIARLEKILSELRLSADRALKVSMFVCMVVGNHIYFCSIKL